jgi:hypothetical protein
MTTSGTVVATIAAGVATDAAGNSNVASTSTDNTVTWDSVAPSVTIDLNAASDSGVSNTDNLTNAANLVFTLTFSESVTGVTAADLTTTGSTATGCVIGNPTGSGATRSVTLTGCSNGSVVLTFLANGASDLAGNTGPASDVSLTVTVDRIAPTVTINQALGQVDPTNVSPIAFTVVFSETVAGFITGDVAVGGTSGGTKTGTVSGGPITFDVAVTGMTTSGTVVATIAASRATDLAGNNNTASTSTDNSVAWDRATHVAFVQQPTDTVYGSTIAPAVTVAILDASDQVVTETSKSVTLTLAPSGPSLGGTLTVATVNGVATFPDLTVDAVGTYTLDATSFGLTGATSASFDITPAPLTITADDRIKTYGQTVVFAGTEFTSSGLLNADTVTSVTLTSPGAVDTATVAGSPYPITPSAAIGGGLTNYAVTYVPGSLTVDRADPTIAVTGYSVTYDASPHSATGTATGAFGEDLSADLDLSATTHTAVGSYTDPWTFTDSTGNYNDDAGTVDSEITPAPLTVTADDQSKPFGVPFTFAGTEFTTSGLFGADTVDSATLTSAGTAAAAAPGSYPISISGALGVGLANYAITYVDGTLTVGNTTPVVGDADVTTRATASVAGTVSVTDPDTGQTVTLSIISGPAHGSATVAADGSFMYTPTGSYTGDDTFTIEGCDDDPTPACDTGTVTVAVYPVAVDDDATVTTEGATIEVDVQANDVGDAGPVTIVSGPAHGTARVGSIIYTPDAGFSGTDQVVYRICSPNDPALCDDGTLSITVTGAAPETDTEVPIAVTLDDIARDPLPPLVMLLLTIAAIVAAGAVAKRSRSAGR